MKFRALKNFASNFMTLNKNEIIEIKDCKNYIILGKLIREGFIEQIEGKKIK